MTREFRSRGRVSLVLVSLVLPFSQALQQLHAAHPAQAQLYYAQLQQAQQIQAQQIQAQQLQAQQIQAQQVAAAQQAQAQTQAATAGQSHQRPARRAESPSDVAGLKEQHHRAGLASGRVRSRTRAGGPPSARARSVARRPQRASPEWQRTQNCNVFDGWVELIAEPTPHALFLPLVVGESVTVAVPGNGRLRGDGAHRLIAAAIRV